jgi:hypothetical protein
VFVTSNMTLCKLHKHSILRCNGECVLSDIHTVFIVPFTQIHIARYRHILTQTPRKGTARKGCNHKRQRATRASRLQRFRLRRDSRGSDSVQRLQRFRLRRDSRGSEKQQTQNRTRHRPPATAKPNRTTPLHYLIRRPGQAGAKTTAQSTSQEPVRDTVIYHNHFWQCKNRFSTVTRPSCPQICTIQC